MFELYQLQQLLVVAGCGTLSGAAEQLHLSQPALSRSMQRLEREVQVPLFVRRKNRIELNKNGELAVEYARRIMDEAAKMAAALREQERRLHTICVGSCAPAPLWEISPALSNRYADMTISSEIRDCNLLEQGLLAGEYQLIILPYPFQREHVHCVEYAREQLFFSLPPSHPLSDRKSLCLHDMNGETMLLRNRLGFWEHIISKDDKMPDTHFIVQNERDFHALVQASVLPNFASDWAMRREGTQPNRVYIPISDTEVHVTYHCCCLSQDKTMRAFLSQYLKNHSL